MSYGSNDRCQARAAQEMGKLGGQVWASIVSGEGKALCGLAAILLFRFPQPSIFGRRLLLLFSAGHE